MSSFLKRFSYPHCVVLAPLPKIIWLFMLRFISGSLFYSSGYVCLLLCQYHTLFINVALWYVLKSGSMRPPVLFFLKTFVLAIRSPLWSHMNLHEFWDSFFYFCKKCHCEFDRDCIESVDCLEYYGHFNNIKSANSWIWDIFLFMCVFFNFFQQCFIIFSV